MNAIVGLLCLTVEIKSNIEKCLRYDIEKMLNLPSKPRTCFFRQTSDGSHLLIISNEYSLPAQVIYEEKMKIMSFREIP